MTSFSQRVLNIHPWRVYSAVWSLHGWCQGKVLPSRHVLCTPHNHAPRHVISCERHAQGARVSVYISMECRVQHPDKNKKQNVTAWGVVSDMATGTPHLKNAAVVRPRGQYHRGQYHRGQYHTGQYHMGQYHMGQLKLHVLGSAVPPVVINAYHQSLLTRTTNRY